MYEIKEPSESFDDFLTLPARLYTSRKLTQNKSDELALLSGTHILSHCFTVIPITGYKDGVCCSRCMLTLYPDKDEAYLGFFECTDDSGMAAALLSYAKKKAAECGRTRLTGPVDASFWLRYRMKVNRFDDKRAYISEPYNLPYYRRLWEENGFAVTEEYVSNLFGKIPLKNSGLEKFSKRLERFTAKGYSIVSPDKNSWDKCVDEVYSLITVLYSDFPVFSDISREDFRALYSGYKLILDFSFVKMAYFDGKPVGFFIGMPDYKNHLCKKPTLLTLLYVTLRKRFGKRYVLLYLGADKNHAGLGAAITQTLIERIARKNITAIGAFIKRGKVTAGYAHGQIKGEYEYLLFGTDLAAKDSKNDINT